MRVEWSRSDVLLVAFLAFVLGAGGCNYMVDWASVTVCEKHGYQHGTFQPTEGIVCWNDAAPPARVVLQPPSGGK